MDLRGGNLVWTRSDPSKLSDITMSFHVRESLTSIGDAQKRAIGEILINFPSGFVHNVYQVLDVTVQRKTTDGRIFTPGTILGKRSTTLSLEYWIETREY